MIQESCITKFHAMATQARIDVSIADQKHFEIFKELIGI